MEDEAFGPLSPEQLDLVRTARQDLHRQLRIIQDLLDLSKLESGRSRLNVAPLSADKLLRAVVADAAEAAREREVTINVDVDHDGTEIEADGERLRILLENFLLNAIRSTPSGGAVDVGLSTRSDGKEVCFSFRDYGAGLSEQDRVRIFEKFYRAQTGLKATGLGLSIAREIAVMHGGDVGCTSTPGGGTEFSCILPVAQERLPFQTPAQRRRQAEV